MSTFGIYGWQGQGKTLSAVALIEDGYAITHKKIVSNVEFYNTPAKVLNVAQMRIWVRQMVQQCLEDYIILIDEIDKVFPARFWNDKEQSEALIGFWQDEKLNNDIIYTCHRSGGADKLIRDSTNIIAEPFINKKLDLLELIGYDRRYNHDFSLKIVHYSYWFKRYNRWAKVR